MILRVHREFGLIKGLGGCLLSMTMAATAFAGPADGLVVAAISNDRPTPAKQTVLPPVVSEIYEYYEVGGCREEDLKCDLKQKSVAWTDGRKYDSVTRWKVGWDYGHRHAFRQCAADSFRVNVEVVFRYPRWVRNNDAPRELVEKWDIYLSRLSMHENRHRDIVVEAADALTRAVADMPAARSCVELDREVKALCRDRMEKLVQAQNEYDAITDHGQAEGAVFP